MSTFTWQFDRILAGQYGREAVEIGECGHYRAPSGLTVNIKALLSSAVKGTVSYPVGDIGNRPKTDTPYVRSSLQF